MDEWKQVFLELGTIPLFFISFVSHGIEHIFPPWPGDTVTVFLGFLYSGKAWNSGVVLFGGFLGNLAGAFLMYHFGSRFLLFLQNSSEIRLQKMAEARDLKRAQDLLRKHGFWFLVFSRFSAGIRFFVSILAGMSSMSLPLFFSGMGLGNLLWSGGLFFFGSVLGENWNQGIEILKNYNRWMVLVLIFLLGFWLTHRARSKT